MSLSLALIEPDDEAWLELLADTEDSGDREIGDISPLSVELAILLSVLSRLSTRSSVLRLITY